MRHEFANHEMRNFSDRRRFDSRRRQERNKLAEIIPVAPKCVRRGVAHGAQIIQELVHRGFHFPPLRQDPKFNGASPWPVSYSQQPKRLRQKTTSLKLRLAPGHALIAPTGSGTATTAGGSGTAASQSQPSFRQARIDPNLPTFSTMNGAPHFGHGSAI